MKRWIKEDNIPVLDCSKFKSDEELANAIMSSDSCGMILVGCPDNAHYRRMNQQNPGQVFQIGDMVRMSKDMLESLGMETDDIEKGVVVGVEQDEEGNWFYKVRYDGRVSLYQHYELDLVASHRDLMNRMDIEIGKA
jgi:hypothetical protein